MIQLHSVKVTSDKKLWADCTKCPQTFNTVRDIILTVSKLQFYIRSRQALLCMRYHTAWFASIVDCNVKKAIVSLWRATLCSSFGDWWGCMETCLTQDTRRSPASRIGPDNWQTLQVLSEYIHFEAYCSLFALGVLGVKLSHILHYSHCRWESKFTRGNTFTRELLRGKIMKNRSAFWQRKIIPQMRLILALG